MTRIFFVSFTNIYDHFQARSAKTFMNIYGSLMIIFDQKKSFMTRKNFCLIDDHF